MLHDGSGYLGGVVPGIVLTASGIGLALPAAAAAMTSTAPPAHRGVAGALFTTRQQTGSAIGLAALATIAASSARSYEAVFLTTGVLAVAALAASAVIGVLGRRGNAIPSASRPAR